MILMKSDGAVVTCSAAALRRSLESLVVTEFVRNTFSAGSQSAYSDDSSDRLDQKNWE